MLRVVEKKHGIKNFSKLIIDHFENIDRVMITNFVIINSYTFEKGLFIIFLDEMHQIEAVLKFEDSFIFLCTRFETVKYYKFANCFEIEKVPDGTLIIEFNNLVCKRSYEAKYLNSRTQIIADDLDMIPIYENFGV